MTKFRRTLQQLAAVAAVGIASHANAALILDTGITTGPGGFNPDATGTDTNGNDLPGLTGNLRFGQLYADTAGIVEFFYVGTEAGYTNTLVLNSSLLLSGVSSYSSTPGFNFAAPDATIGSITVGKNQYVDFGFCTSGGQNVGSFGKCAYNDDAASLIAQYNYKESSSSEAGYRSIAFRALTSYNPVTGLANTSNYASWSTLDSHLWGLFWDDSGAKNDDNHDDFIAVARFRPAAVPEPSTLFLIGIGILAIGVVGRRARK